MSSTVSTQTAQAHIRSVGDFRIQSGVSLQCFRCSGVKKINCFPLVSETIKGHQSGFAKMVLHPYCGACLKARETWIEAHPLFTHELDDFWQDRARGLKRRCKQHSMVLGVVADDLIELFLKQDGRCAVTGIQLHYLDKDKGKSVRGGRALKLASLDRIDSCESYVLGNVHIVCQAVNIMKNDLSMQAFLDMCELITSQRMSGAIASDVTFHVEQTTNKL